MDPPPALPLPDGARLYVVGGAVRDALLGLVPQDRDWVAVGTTPEALEALGFRRVGQDFPVFLHPRTGEEVALARTERKAGRGYRGFVVHAAPEVTLEEDLLRRDLTINAIAQAPDGTLIDPWGGRRDLEQRVLRHVSPAFVEDPVRLLRLARLAARFADFRIAAPTWDLLRRLVDEGEIDHLVPERVWQELSRGLMAQRPSRLWQVLLDCGALQRLLPEIAPPGAAAAAMPPSPEAPVAPRWRALDLAAVAQAELPVRWALSFPPPTAPQAAAAAAAAHRASLRLRAPAACDELAVIGAREAASGGAEAPRQAPQVLALLERCDALRRPSRFAQWCQVSRLRAQADTAAPTDRATAAVAAPPEPGGTPASGPPGGADPVQALVLGWQAAQAVDVAAAAAAAQAAGARGPAIGEAVRQARLLAIASALAGHGQDAAQAAGQADAV